MYIHYYTTDRSRLSRVGEGEDGRKKRKINANHCRGFPTGKRSDNLRIIATNMTWKIYTKFRLFISAMSGTEVLGNMKIARQTPDTDTSTRTVWAQIIETYTTSLYNSNLSVT